MAESSCRAQEREAILAYHLHGNCYLNITHHCTLRCAFCPKFQGSWEVQGHNLRLYGEPTAQELVDAVGDATRFKAIVFCGFGEPTLRLEVLLQVAAALKAQGATIRVNTDGLANLVYDRDVTPEFAGLVDALSISMNAQDELTYNRHCRPKQTGAYPAMLEFARLARRHVPRVTLTAIDGLPGVDIEACRRIAEDIGVEFRRRELDVVG